MSQTTDARPSQVTLAGWMITSGSVLLVVSLFATMSSLRSLDTRRSVEVTLAEPPLDTSGISVEGFLQLLHASALVAGGCAAAMAVLGVYALRRHRGARVVLSVLAVPLFVAGIVAGGLLSSVVAASVVLLWLKPSRDWFSHVPREVPEAPDRPAGRDQQDQQRTSDAPPPVDAPWPPPVAGGEAPRARPYTGYGTAEGRPGPPSGPQTGTLPRPWGAAPPAAPPRGDARSRPGAVLAACLVTWVFSSLVVALMLVGVAQAFLSADLLFDEVRAQQPQALEESGLTPGALATTMAVMCGLLALWALGAILAAVLAFRGSPAGRTTLVVSTAVTGVLALGAGFVQPVFWLLAIGAALVLVCLLRPEVRAWYAGRGGMGR